MKKNTQLTLLSVFLISNPLTHVFAQAEADKLTRTPVVYCYDKADQTGTGEGKADQTGTGEGKADQTGTGENKADQTGTGENKKETVCKIVWK